MIKNVLVALTCLIFVSCSSKEKKDADIKAQDLKTSVERAELLSSKETLGVNKDEEVIVQKKTKLVDYLKEVSYEVRKKQDELYGSRRFNTRGLFGRYEECMSQKKQKPKIARQMVLKDQELGQINADKFGYDEKGQLVAVEEQKLRDKIRDMEDKKNRLFAQEEELLTEVRTCENDSN
ncbi:MAG: hypothetical protein RJB66_1124 [Pseudomonadota bacterium]